MNCLYTANIGFPEYYNKSELLIKKYCESNNIAFECIKSHRKIDHIKSIINTHPFKGANYSSIYSIYNFLDSNYERMIWSDIDVLLLIKENLFNILPNLYLENGYPEGKIYYKDCCDNNNKLQKLQLINTLTGLDYTITVSSGLFSMDKENAQKFVNNIEEYVDFNSFVSLNNFCNMLNRKGFTPRDEPFFELFVIKNNIIPKKIVKTLYTKEIKTIKEEEWKCDIVHFSNIDGKEIFENLLKKDEYANL
jgi:hypothetical protein